jgi:hypothetical protein
MHNYFTIETEAASRRREWTRAAAADRQAAQAQPGNGQRPGVHLPRFAVSRRLSLSVPRVPLTALWAPDCPTPAC